MSLKRAAIACAVSVGIVGLGVLLRRLRWRRRRKPKRRKRKRTERLPLTELSSAVGGSSKHAIKFQDLVKLATCDNPQLRKHAIELCIFKVTETSANSPTSPHLATIFKFCRRLSENVNDEEGAKALAVLACLTINGLSNSRGTSPWFHGHPQTHDLVDTLASVVEALAKGFRDKRQRGSGLPSVAEEDEDARSDDAEPFDPPDQIPSRDPSFTTAPSPSLPNSRPTTLYLLKVALGALFRVTVDAAPAKSFLMERRPGFLSTVVALVQAAPSKDVVRFGFFLLHQLALLAGGEHLNIDEAAAVVTNALRKYQGEPVLEKLGLQILVIFFKTTAEVEGARGSRSVGIQSLLKMLIQKESLLLPLVSCFRHASTDVDADVIYWCCVILHEMTANDVEVKSVAQTPGIFSCLARALALADDSHRSLLLKIIYQLSSGSELFRLQILYNREVLQKISLICFVGDPSQADRELVYWCLLLLHDLAMLGPPMTSDLLSFSRRRGDKGDLLESLISIRHLKDPFLSRLLAETLGFFCSDERIHGRLLRAGIVEAVLSYMDTSPSSSSSSTPIDPDLLLWAVASLLNLAMTSKAAQKAILHHGGVGILLRLVDKGCPSSNTSRGQIAVMAAKTLTMLSHTRELLMIQVNVDDESLVVRLCDRKSDGLDRPIPGQANQITVNRSSSVAIVLVDPSCAGAVLTDMSSVITSRRGGPVPGTPRRTAADLARRMIQRPLTPDNDLQLPFWDHPPTKSALPGAPDLDSLAFHCAQPSRVVLVWWRRPGERAPPAQLLTQILREGEFGDRPRRPSTPGDGETCVIVGEVDDSSSFRVLSYNVGLLDHDIPAHPSSGQRDSSESDSIPVEIHLSQSMSFADVASSAVARSALEPLLVSLGKHQRGDEASLCEELELVEILCRHWRCQRLLTSSRVLGSFFAMIRLLVDRLDRIAEKRESDPDASDRLLVPHAVGCLRILSVVAMNSEGAETLIGEDLIDLVANLLQRLVRIWIDMMGDVNVANDEMKRLSSRSSDGAAAAAGAGKHAELDAVDRRHSMRNSGSFRFSVTSPGDKVSASPPWYVTPEASTPGERFFTPSVEEENRIVGGDGDVTIGAKSPEKRAPSTPRTDIGAGGDGKATPTKMPLPVVNSAPSNDEDEKKDSMTEKSNSERMSVDRDAERRPESSVSVGQEDDEFILLPVFDPQFDELFTSVARSSLVLLSNLTQIPREICEDWLDDALRLKAVYGAWSVLTCSNAVLKQWISIPSSAAIAALATAPEIDPSSFQGVTMSAQDKTPGLLLSGSRLDATNINWTFESGRATHGVGGLECFARHTDPPKGWYFEVTLLSSGIIQLGWAAKNSLFQPVEGMGVGDSKWSFAFDGSRCKTWNGPVTTERENNYGREWNEDDVVSCLLRNRDGVGEIEYWLGGQSMGLAFVGVDVRKYTWYPAASFATDQMCSFNFGASNFRYNMPPGFFSVDDYVSQVLIEGKAADDVADKVFSNTESLSVVDAGKHRSSSCSGAGACSAVDPVSSSWGSDKDLDGERSDGHDARRIGGRGGISKPTTLDLKHKFSSLCRSREDLTAVDGIPNASSLTRKDAFRVKNIIRGEAAALFPHTAEPGPTPVAYFECLVDCLAASLLAGFRVTTLHERNHIVETTPTNDLTVLISRDSDRHLLTLPNGSTCSIAGSTTIGVGLVREGDVNSSTEFRVFVVKDGVASFRFFDFPFPASRSGRTVDSVSGVDIVVAPVLSRTDLKVNWGQTNFHYAPANSRECKTQTSVYFYRNIEIIDGVLSSSA